MKLIILLLINYFLFLAMIVFSSSLAEDIYRFRIMGKIKSNSVTLPDMSIFNMFDSEGAFTDSDGNYGDVVARGVRETDSNGQLINITALIVFESIDGSKIFARPNRKNSELGAGAGYFDVLFASESFNRLQGAQCNYALTVTKQEAFIMEGICK